MANAQKNTPGWSDARRRRWGWVRASLADVAGGGQKPSREDIDALPEAHRAEARTIAEHAIALHGTGSQAAALSFARERFADLESGIGSNWRPPPPERADAALLDQIQGRAI